MRAAGLTLGLFFVPSRQTNRSLRGAGHAERYLHTSLNKLEYEIHCKD